MHELSIASSIMKTVLNEVENRKYKSVLTISLRIGALTDIVPDSLSFGFEAISKDTILEKTKLLIETVPIQGSCKNCNYDFEVFSFIFRCPNCSSDNIDVSQGNELEITYIETDT